MARLTAWILMFAGYLGVTLAIYAGANPDPGMSEMWPVYALGAAVICWGFSAIIFILDDIRAYIGANTGEYDG